MQVGNQVQVESAVILFKVLLSFSQPNFESGCFFQAGVVMSLHRLTECDVFEEFEAVHIRHVHVAERDVGVQVDI